MVPSIRKVHSQSVWSQDAVSISLHKPTFNFLQGTVRYFENSLDCILALPQGRSEISLLHWNSNDRGHVTGCIRVHPLRHTIKLPYHLPIRALAWVPDSNRLVVALHERLLIYSIVLVSPLDIKESLVYDIALPTGTLPAQLISLQGQEHESHILILSTAQKVLYLHINEKDSKHSVHTHTILDHIKAFAPASDGGGIHVLDKHHRYSFYSIHHIRTRLCGSAHAAHKISTVVLDNHGQHVTAMAVMDGTLAVISIPQSEAIVHPTSHSQGFKHILAGSSLSEALHVPFKEPQVEEGSVLDHLMQITSRAEEVTGLHSPLKHVTSADGRALIEDLDGSPTKPVQFAEHIHLPNVRLFACQRPLQCEHFTAMLGTPQVLSSTNLDINADLLAIHYTQSPEEQEGGNTFLLAMGSTTHNDVWIYFNDSQQLHWVHTLSEREDGEVKDALSPQYKDAVINRFR